MHYFLKKKCPIVSFCRNDSLFFLFGVFMCGWQLLGEWRDWVLLKMAAGVHRRTINITITRRRRGDIAPLLNYNS